MLNLANAFSAMADRAAAAFGAPFHDGAILSQATAGSYDDDGVFLPGSAPNARPCRVQVDAASEYMRANGYAEGEYRFIILRASFDGDLDTDARVRIDSGVHAGEWLVSSLELDSAAIGFVGKGRPA